jgi:hypothetical protein
MNAEAISAVIFAAFRSAHRYAKRRGKKGAKSLFPISGISASRLREMLRAAWKASCLAKNSLTEFLLVKPLTKDRTIGSKRVGIAFAYPDPV